MEDAIQELKEAQRNFEAAMRIPYKFVSEDSVEVYWTLAGRYTNNEMNEVVQAEWSNLRETAIERANNRLNAAKEKMRGFL